MDGIVTLLDPIHTHLVEVLWGDLGAACGLDPAAAIVIPHFSWHVAEAYDEARVNVVLKELAASIHPFTVRTTGIGLFTAPKPVVYIPIVKNPTLIRFHEVVWNALEGAALKSVGYYAPEAWVPHITLLYEDQADQMKLGIEHVQKAVGRLLYSSFDWELSVDNLALSGQAIGEQVRGETTAGICARFDFSLPDRPPEVA